MNDNPRRCCNAAWMDADDDDVAAFLARYNDACAEVGASPLPLDDLVVLVRALLTGAIPAMVTLH